MKSKITVTASSVTASRSELDSSFPFDVIEEVAIELIDVLLFQSTN